jgi:uncharacterized delta-60 repeat protein
VKKILFSLLFIPACFAQTLDPSFDTDGKMSINIGGESNIIYDMALQSDGKIVAVGYTLTGIDYDIAVARFNSDGSLDLTFNSIGYDLVDFGFNTDIAYGVAIQSDGKIIVAGSASNASNEDFVLLRYNTDGTLDLSFDTDGIVLTTFGTSYEMAYDVVIQPDGKIIAVGSAYPDTTFYFAAARYNTNGSLDASFDGDGKFTTLLGIDDEANSVAIQGDGKIILAGRTKQADFQYAVGLARLNTNGSLDNTFDTDGKKVTSITPYSDMAQDVALQSDGKIVIGGKGTPVGPEQYALVRYNTDGSLDNSFDTDGMVLTAFGTSWDECRSLVIQSDGKILAGGIASVPAKKFAIARYNTDGSLDLSWDLDGKLTTTFSSIASIWSLIIQPDGKLLAGGYAGATGTSFNFAIARYGDVGKGGIEDITHNTLSVFPNPVQQNFTLKYTLTQQEKLTITLVGLDGKVISVLMTPQEKEIGDHTQSFVIPETIANGNYFVVLSSPNGTALVKIVKK